MVSRTLAHTPESLPWLLKPYVRGKAPANLTHVTPHPPHSLGRPSSSQFLDWTTPKATCWALAVCMAGSIVFTSPFHGLWVHSHSPVAFLFLMAPCLFHNGFLSLFMYVYTSFSYFFIFWVSPVQWYLPGGNDHVCFLQDTKWRTTCLAQVQHSANILWMDGWMNGWMSGWMDGWMDDSNLGK